MRAGHEAALAVLASPASLPWAPQTCSTPTRTHTGAHTHTHTQTYTHRHTQTHTHTHRTWPSQCSDIQVYVGHSGLGHRLVNPLHLACLSVCLSISVCVCVSVCECVCVCVFNSHYIWHPCTLPFTVSYISPSPFPTRCQDSSCVCACESVCV